MKMLIVAGGTGSIALQTGLYSLLRDRTDDLEIKVLVNAYDNGLSTGAVRRVLGGQILGPSDVRKNQTTRYSLLYGRTDLLEFLDHRFTAASAEAREYALKKLDGLKIEAEKKSILADGIKAYFNHTIAGKIDYTDFSLANIIYAGLAAKAGNSLRVAAAVMAGVLDIPDHVILNDDTSLFLGAISKSGVRVTDEGDIVSWNNPDDPFVDVFFTDADGNEKSPVLCNEAKRAIADADVIILSSGTQWSSLIPTYASVGFLNAVSTTKAKILMVMNKTPDKDAPGQGADDIVKAIVPRYFPENKIDLIMDMASAPMMQTIKAETSRNLLKSVNLLKLSDDWGLSPAKHSAMHLAHAVCRTIYRDFIDATVFMFDFDDTLVGRGNTSPKASRFNRDAFKELNETKNVAICTGNSIKVINLDQTAPYPDYPKGITIYADGGVNKYEYNPKARRYDEEAKPYRFVECLVPAAQFNRTGPKSAANIISTLRLGGIPTAKIENRGDVMLTIKPIDPEYREIVRNLASRLLDRSGLKVKSAGRTTIEIASDHVSKAAAVEQMVHGLDNEHLVFIGDEFDGGNDASVLHLSKTDKRIKCLKVSNPTDTAIFMTALKPLGPEHG